MVFLGCTLELEEFHITDIGNIDIEISGLGPLDWILGKVLGLVGDLIKGEIAHLIEGPIRDLLAKLLHDYVPDIP